MLNHLRLQLHRLLRQRSGQLLLALLVFMSLALPVSAAMQAHPAAATDTLQQRDDHCAHHAQVGDADHSAAHHEGDHHCRCAQACHANPVALVAATLNLPPAAQPVQPLEQHKLLVAVIRPPLYRPPIALAA